MHKLPVHSCAYSMYLAAYAAMLYTSFGLSKWNLSMVCSTTIEHTPRPVMKRQDLLKRQSLAMKA